MSIALTNPAAVTPPPFSAGLNVWSQTTGRPGTPTYATASFAAFVPSDPDFASALEVQKTTSVVRLRWTRATPIQAGSYLRVRARVKGIAGVLPSVRIAAWAGTSAGVEATGIVTTGPETALTTYGEIVEVTAIIGTGTRPSVNMAWPLSVQIAHLGLDLTGPTGGVVRIDDLVIEDVTPLYATEQIGVVDVRDYGALGNGTTDDRAAFVAAMAAAGGRPLLVPAGSYRIATSLTITVPVIFRGTLSMPDAAVLILQRNYDQPSYAAAFGTGEAGFRKGLQALFHTDEHMQFDLMGRRVQLTGPVDVRTLAGLDGTSARRILCNGQLDFVDNPAWSNDVTTRVATYNPTNPTLLTGVTNVAAVAVGSRVSGVGVGREVYVRARNISAGTLTLSMPLYGGAMTQSFTFTRFKYALDFSGFTDLRNFEFDNIEFLCRGRGSCVMLPVGGRIFKFRFCDFDRPRDRAVTSAGVACQGLMIDNCQFSSSQMTLNSQDRTVIGFNVNSNDAKIRDNRVVLWAHFGVMAGTTYLINGNHFFQGDDTASGIRQAGLVLTGGNVCSTIEGNYIDNCFIEMTNEHSPNPQFTSGFSFGGLTVTGNIFFAINVAPWFSFIVFKPYGSGHFIQGLTVTGNAFRPVGIAIDRVDRVDTTFANLSFDRFRNLLFHSNTFNGVLTPAECPAVVIHEQATAATTWTIDSAGKMPFGGRVRTVPSMTMEGPARDGANAIRYDMPHILTNQGPGNDQARLVWPVAVRGLAVVTLRVDRPI